MLTTRSDSHIGSAKVRFGCFLLSVCVVFPSASALPKPSEMWFRVDLPHFTLFSNADCARTLEVGAGLERFRSLLETIAEGVKTEPSLPSRVYVFRDSQSFEDYRGRSGIAGYFIETSDESYIAINASAGQEPLRVICHEYVHQFLRENFPGTPLWLSEGLAEFYSTFQETGSTVQVGQPIPRHLEVLRRGRWIPMERLFEITPRSREYNVRDWMTDFYAESWVVTHYLIGSDQMRRRHIGEFFSLLQLGRDPREVLLASIGMDLSTLERAAKAYARQPSFAYYQLVLPGPLAAGKEPDLAPLDRAGVFCRLGDLLVHTRPLQADEVEKRVQAALALDPNLADAFITLGMLRQAQNRLDEAEGTLERAIAMGSRDARAYRLTGSMALDRAAGMPKDTPEANRSRSETLSRARERLRKSLGLESRNPRTLFLLGKACAQDPAVTGSELEEGINALRKARRRLGANGEVAFDLLWLLARKGESGEARSILEESIRPLKPDPALVADAERVVVDAEIAKADDLAVQGKTDDALALIEGAIKHTSSDDLKRILAECESRIRAPTQPTQKTAP